MIELTSNDKRVKIEFFVINQFSIIVSSFVVSLFSLFILSDNFVLNFSVSRALETTGFILTNYFLFWGLFVALIVFAKRLTKLNEFTLIFIVVTLTYIACISAINYLNVYAMPVALCALLVGVLLKSRSAICSVAALAMLLFAAMLFNGNLSIFSSLNITGAILSNTIAALSVIYFISRHYTRIKFLFYALSASLVALPFVIASSLAAGIIDLNLLFNALWAIAANVFAILLFMPLLPIFESSFNIADDFRLDELTSLKQPLLKRLASEAPGTFNHSLVVGTLAESCAMAIGENPLLAKAGAYYHDAGKLKAPVYFVENQSDYNPHDELIPEVSASMITSHTLFGEILNKQYRLPEAIVKISKEHHGTSPVGYFYKKALNLTEGTLPIDNYVYPGPKPSTKISAIIMIADTAEAAFRALMPETKKEFIEKITKLIDEKIKLGQLDDCPITLSELEKIKQTIINVLPSIHHSRINYERSKTKKK